MRKGFLLLVLSAFLIGFNAKSVNQSTDTVFLTLTDVNKLYTNVSKSYPGVHDPSVVYNNNGTYYIFGSHNAIARTNDLRNWTSVGNSSLYGVQNSNGSVSVTSYNNAFKTNMTKTVKVLKEGIPTDVTFGNFDAAAWNCAIAQDGKAWTVAGNMWAPDVIYNVAMKKWCMYLSLNGPRWNSTIILLTSNAIEGPYVYQGPVVYTGFRNTTDPKISWKLTDLELVIGAQSTLPSRYNRGEGWGSYLPHAIDPCVFYDEQGQLWMAYGSWSGGIFMLKLNAENGLRDYTATYPIKNDGSGHPLSDPYFGTQIAGGYYVSGEGPYIKYIGDRYYLFVTYGGLEAAKGYTMRTFSSKNPDGPYLDNSGESAIFNRYILNFGPNDASNRGNLLVGAFGEWSLQTNGEVAQGHNSATVDSKGRAFVVYHTRFNTGNEFFQDRVHQLFTSENGWLLSAPMEFNGETVNNDSIAAGCHFALSQIPGEYNIIIHKFGLNNEALTIAKPVKINLTEDGKITGAYTGTWKMTDGTGYISFNVAGIFYRGVVVPQTIDGSSLKAVGITGAAQNGQMAWAYKVLPQYSVAYNAKKILSTVINNSEVSSHIDLSATTYFGASYTWQSSHPSVISNTGKYNPADTVTKVTLTSNISAENYVYMKTYTVQAAKADSLPGDYLTGIVSYYDFDTIPVTNRYNVSQKGTLSKLLYGTVAALKIDGARIGQVLHINGGKNSSNTGSFCQMPNPLVGKAGNNGVTISAWVKRDDVNDLFGTLWSFTSQSPTLATKQNRLFITGNSYVGFTNQVDTFSINYPKMISSNIPAKTWKLVTVVIDTARIDIFVNGLKLSKTFASTSGTLESGFDFKKVLEMVNTSGYFTIGLGNGIASATSDYDDLLIYNRALTDEDVKLLYSRERRVTDFTAGISTGFDKVKNDGKQRRVNDNIYYDITGRKILKPVKAGIYFYNGEKIILKNNN